MPIVECPSCGKLTPDWKAECRDCGTPLTATAARQQASRDLADEIASRTTDDAYASWQRSVIMNVLGGGGLAGMLLVLSSALVCGAAAYSGWRVVGLVGRLVTDKPLKIPGALFVAIGVAGGVAYFRIAARGFYRIHRRRQKAETPSA